MKAKADCLILLNLLVLLLPLPSFAEEGIADIVEKIKPSIVGVGTFQRTRSPAAAFRGTGFVINDGTQVMTNFHVLPESVKSDQLETLAVFVRENGKELVRTAEVIAQDQEHDIAILSIPGTPLPAMTLGNSEKVREGDLFAFTGYPIGVVLGLHPATHRAMISAITPVAIPAPRAAQISKAMFDRLHDPYDVFQLDATAYPGNSGSPLYDTKTGHVVGIINKVFVQESKESILSKPSGISYAIPIRYAHALLKKQP